MRHYPAPLRKAASALADATMQLSNMVGHSGHVHKTDAVVVKMREKLDEFLWLQDQFDHPEEHPTKKKKRKRS